jgi:DNA-binding transcriptional MocR family regulator
MSSLAAPLPSQLAILDYLQERSFERHLRSLRHALARQQAAAIRAVEQYFPAGTRVTRPQGGYFVWVELPADIDALMFELEFPDRPHRLLHIRRCIAAPDLDHC